LNLMGESEGRKRRTQKRYSWHVCVAAVACGPGPPLRTDVGGLFEGGLRAENKGNVTCKRNLIKQVKYFYTPLFIEKKQIEKEWGSNRNV